MANCFEANVRKFNADNHRLRHDNKHSKKMNESMFLMLVKLLFMGPSRCLMCFDLLRVFRLQITASKCIEPCNFDVAKITSARNTSL